MKKYAQYLKVLFVFLGVIGFSTSIKCWAESSIVINVTDGVIQHQQKPDQLHPPASLTKMMTLYLVFEAIKQGDITLDDIVTVSKKATLAEPGKLFLKEGEQISLRQLVMGCIIKSANDAAIAIAEYLADSEEAFAERMTQKAQELGMHSTTFKNASGLPHPEQITTARDMARLGYALFVHHKNFYPLFSVKQASIRGKKYKSYNKLILEGQGVDGIKTGYIKSSKFNLVSSFLKPDGTRLIGVVLGERSPAHRDYKMATLLGHPISERIRLGEVKIHKKGKSEATEEWLAQLGVFQKKPSAKSFLSKLKKQHKGGYRLIKENGLHKVYFGTASSKKDAQKVCHTLKTKGIDCLPKKRGK